MKTTTLWAWDSKPFGESQPDEDVDKDGNSLSYNLRFPGQYYDQETGKHYNFNRDYDPSTGRYIQSDLIGLDGGLNSYRYSDSNTVSHFDVKGLCTSSASGDNDQQLLARLMNAEARISETRATAAGVLWQAIRAYMGIGFVIRNRIEKGHGFIVEPPGSAYTYRTVICGKGQFANHSEANGWDNDVASNHAMGAAWNVLNGKPDITNGATYFRYRDYAHPEKDNTALEKSIGVSRDIVHTRKIANDGEWIFLVDR